MSTKQITRTKEVGLKLFVCSHRKVHGFRTCYLVRSTVVGDSKIQRAPMASQCVLGQRYQGT
jgi:hypothetical protein